VSVTTNSSWRAHLPPGVDPERRALWAGGRGWLSRGDLDAAGARVAGRLRRAGLAAGDRVLVSAATSMELVVAYPGRPAHGPGGGAGQHRLPGAEALPRNALGKVLKHELRP
jgi:hypothetical protein